MHKLRPCDAPEALRFLTPSGCGDVYARSIAEGFQPGEMFADEQAALFWHYCGFAQLYGAPSEETICWLAETIAAENLPRRFVLFTQDSRIVQALSGIPGAETGQRYFYTYSGTPAGQEMLPAGFRVCKLDAALLERLCGRITPAFSWDSTADFLQKGDGFCLMEGDTPAAWAFSAAVSREEIDIGVETDSRYRRRGLARLAAGCMVERILSLGKAPVWACSAENTASCRLAEGLGFVRSAVCTVIRFPANQS